MAKHPGGRPAKINKDVVTKLEDAFRVGANNTEACFYAGISTRTLARYEEKHPEFSQRKEGLKSQLLLAAKQKIATQILDKKDANTGDAWRLLEKKDPEMKPVQKIEHTGTIASGSEGIEMTPKMKEALRLFNEGLKEQVISEIKAMP